MSRNWLTVIQSLWLLFIPTYYVGDPSANFSWAQCGSFFVFHVIVGLSQVRAHPHEAGGDRADTLQSFFILRVALLYNSYAIAIPAVILLSGSMASGLFTFGRIIRPVPDEAAQVMDGMLGQMRVVSRRRGQAS